MAGYDIGPKIGMEGEAEFRRAIRELNTNLKTMGTELQAVSSQFDRTDKSEKALTAQNEVLHKQMDGQKSKLELLQKGLEESRNKYGENAEATQKWQQLVNRAQAEVNNLDRTLRENEQGLQNVRRGYNEAGQKLDQYGNVVEEAEKKQLKLGEAAASAGKKLGQAMAAALAAASAAVAGLGAYAIKVGSDFEVGMSQVAATMGMTSAEIASGSEAFELLSESAKDAGATTKFSATEASQALNYLALAGYDAEKASAALPAVLDLAAAGGLELAYASDLATDAMAALGIEASRENLTRFGDEMARTASKANTSVAQLGEAILTVGGTAKGLAGGTNELNTSLGVLANRGIKGSEGGTALRNIILSLTAPIDKASDAMKSLGLSVFDAEGDMRPLNDIFKDLDTSLSTMTEGEKTKALDAIFNKVDLKSVRAMLAGCGEEFDILSAAIADSDGAMKNMAEVQIDNLQGAITILKSSMEGFGIEIFESMQEPLKETTRTVTDMIGQMTAAFQEGGPSEAVRVFGSMFAQLAAEAASAAPGLIDTAAQVIQSLLSGFAANVPQLGQAAVEIVMSMVDGIVSILPQFVGVAAQLIGALVTGLVGAFPALVASARDIITNFTGYLKENLPELISSGLDMLLSFATGLNDGVGALIDCAISMIETLAEGIITALPDLIAKIPLIVIQIADIINENAPKLLVAAAKLIGELALGLIQNIPVILANLPKIIEAIWKAFTAFNWVNIGKSIIEGLANGLKSAIGFVKEAAANLSNAIKTDIHKLPGQLLEIGKQVVAGLVTGIKAAAGQAVTAIKNLASNLVDGLKGVLGIHSPSKVFEALGGFTMEGFTLGMKNEGGKTIKTAEELSKAILDAASSWVEGKKFYNELAAKDEAVFWQELIDIGGLGAKELEEVNKKLYTARANVSKEAFNASKKWIEQEKFYNRLSAEEEIAAWERVVNRRNLATEEQLEAERQFYSAKQGLLKDQQKAIEKTLDEQEKAEKKLLDQQQKAYDQYEKAVSSRVNSLEGFAGLFDKIEEKNETSGKELLNNLRDQVAAFQNWQADMTGLEERGVTGGLLDELRDMGPKAAEQIRALTGLSDKELTEYAELFAEKGRLAAEQAQKEIPPVQIPLVLGDMDSGEVGADGAGQSIVFSLSEGAGAALGKVSDVAAQSVGAFIGAVTGNLGLVTASAQSVMKTLTDTVLAGQPEVTAVSGKTAETFCGVLTAKRGSFVSVGLNAMAGLCAGLASEGQRAVALAGEIADAIVAQMNRALGIHSPSKVFAGIGENMALGLELGFTGQMKEVARAVSAAVPAPETAAAPPKWSAGVVSGIVGGLSSLPQAGGGVYHIHLEVGGREMASVLFDPLRDEGRRRGF